MPQLSQVQQTEETGFVAKGFQNQRGVQARNVSSPTDVFCPAFMMTPLLKDILSVSFGLTSAEIEITTLLMNGETVVEVANLRRCTQSTVRSQIRAIYSKTGVSSQIRLIQLVMGVKSNLSLAASFGV